MRAGQSKPSLKVPFIYPLQQTSVLSDSQTYFSQLPQDIIKYVIQPYLRVSAEGEPVADTWVPPRLVWTMKIRSSDYQVAFLANGDVLVNLDDQPYVYRVSPTHREETKMIFAGSPRHPIRFVRDDQSDVLKFSHGFDSFVVPHISQHFSIAQFTSALMKSAKPWAKVERTPTSSLPVITRGQHSIVFLAYPPRADFYSFSQYLHSLALPSLPYQADYSGGYLVCLYQNQLVEVYRCLI